MIIYLITYAYMLCYAKSLQSCPTLCDPIDGRPPGSPIPGILQARTLEWVAISFSNAWKRKVKVKSLSCVWLFATPWTATYQVPPSMDFPGKSTGVGCHCLFHIIYYRNTNSHKRLLQTIIQLQTGHPRRNNSIPRNIQFSKTKEERENMNRPISNQ